MNQVYFGRVVLERGECPFCLEPSLIRDGEHLCCGAMTTAKPKGFRVVSPIPKRPRHRPSPPVQTQILEIQGNKCFYCDREFGSLVWVKKEQTLRIHWDHLVPYVHTFDNREINFVAACHVCNAWKAAKIFESLEEIRGYLHRKWAKALSAMPEALQID